jgi:hypothetical protein
MSQGSPLEIRQDHALINALVSIVIPVVILHKLSVPWGPLNALFFALSFPLGYGVYDFYRKKKLNPITALGFINVMVTGSLAVLGIGGVWFSIKEAFFPFIIGVFIWISSLTKKPVVRTFLINPSVMNWDQILSRLQQNQTEAEFDRHVKLSTRFLAASFFISTALNFTLALNIFSPLDPSLDNTAKSIALNQQIAQMTSWSMIVIMVPLGVILIFVLWHLLKGIERLTGLKVDEILKS